MWFWCLSCLGSSALLRSVVSCLSLALKNSRLLSLQIIPSILHFFFWYSVELFLTSVTLTSAVVSLSLVLSLIPCFLFLSFSLDSFSSSVSLCSNFEYIHACCQPVPLDPICMVGMSLSWAVPLLGQSTCPFSFYVEVYLPLWVTWLLIELSHSFSGLLKKDCYGEMDNFNQIVANGSWCGVFAGADQHSLWLLLDNAFSFIPWVWNHTRKFTYIPSFASGFSCYLSFLS